MSHIPTKREVKEFWEANTCGTHITDHPPFSPEYFQAIEEFRYTQEPFIKKFARFTEWRHKKILEIGIGAGTDFMQFVRAGAQATGIDLTASALQHARHRIALENKSAVVLEADAENLPFADETFDFIYSWGVLHHTPDTKRAIDEVYRTLKKGGETTIMLYHKHSIVVAYWLVARGIVRGELWKKSFQKIVSEGSEWSNKNPLTSVYSRRELRTLFAKFAQVKITAVPTRSYQKSTSLRGKVFDILHRLFPFLGWYIVIEARKL